MIWYNNRNSVALHDANPRVKMGLTLGREKRVFSKAIQDRFEQEGSMVVIVLSLAWI